VDVRSVKLALQDLDRSDLLHEVGDLVERQLVAFGPDDVVPDFDVR